jgi:hypothetical protein
MGRVESEDDVIFGYACGNEFIGDAVVESVVVQPDFVIADFGIKDQGMNSFFATPAFGNQEIASVILAHDNFAGAAVLLAIENFTVILQDLIEGLAMLI